MNIVTFNGYKVSEIILKNKNESNTIFDLENKYSYKVNYLSDNKTCIGKLIIEITDKKVTDQFLIKVELSGFFNYKEDVSKENINVETFKELFPYVRVLITTLTTNAGMPPLVIPSVDFDEQSVNIQKS